MGPQRVKNKEPKSKKEATTLLVLLKQTTNLEPNIQIYEPIGGVISFRLPQYLVPYIIVIIIIMTTIESSTSASISVAKRNESKG